MLHVAKADLHPVRLWAPEDRMPPLWLLEEWARQLGLSMGPGATGTAISDYLENKLLDHVVGASAYTAPVTLYTALFTAAPSDAGGGTEVTGGAYARVAKTNNLTNFPAASGGSKSNANDHDFGTATANWGTITHCAVFDALTVGNLLFWGALTAAKTVSNGDGFKFAATKLSFALD